MSAINDASKRLGRRPALDGVRGIAVLLVIGIHLGLLDGGYVGVDIFLALSGFLITTLVYEEWERTGNVSLRRFYGRRARRLLPALVLLLVGFAVVTVTLNPFNGLWPLGRLTAATLLFINNWVTALAPRHGHVLGALMPTWTLGEEAQFYLLWPLVLALLLRRSTRSAAVLVLLALAIISLLAGGELARHLYSSYNAYTSPLDRGAELLFGCIAAITWREGLVPAALGRRLTGWILAGGIVFVLLEGGSADRDWYLSAGVLAALLIVNLLSDDGAAGGAPQRSLARLLGSPPLRYIGRISYGIYLYHLPIYYLLWTYVPGRSPYFYAPIVLALAFCGAAVSWRLIESPIVGWTRARRPLVPGSAATTTASAVAR
jgi:peptidoglycan/LPS O-acetylase OafA/YrhL